MQGSQTAEAGGRACHSATLPLDGPPDDTTIAWWAEIVRRSSDTALEIRTTRSSAKKGPEGPEEKITIEIRTESGGDDAGAAWIKYENESVTLAGEGPDEATALQWMKRLSARFLQPDDEKEQEAGEPGDSDSEEGWLAERIPPEGCIATEDGVNRHLDAATLLARRTEKLKQMHANVRAAARTDDATWAWKTLVMMQRNMRDDARVTVAERKENGWTRYITVPMPRKERERLKGAVKKGLTGLIARTCGTRPGKENLKATIEAARTLGEMAAREPHGKTREWIEMGKHESVPQAGAIATLANADGWMRHRAAEPRISANVKRAIEALAERESVKRGLMPIVMRTTQGMLLSAGSQATPENGAVLKGSIDALSGIETARTLEKGRAEFLAICARRLLVRIKPEECDEQWDAIIETIATSDTPEMASAAAIRTHWMGGFHQGEADELIWALERRTNPIQGDARAQALRTMATALPRRILGADGSYRAQAGEIAEREVERLCSTGRAPR